MPKNGRITPWKILTRYPPVFVRLYAKERNKRIHSALSDEEVAIRGNIDLEKVKSISKLTSWDSVTIGDAKKFITGCNFDPLNYLDRNRISAYTKKGTYAFLRKSSHWDTIFLPLIKIFQNAKNTQN